MLAPTTLATAPFAVGLAGIAIALGASCASHDAHSHEHAEVAPDRQVLVIDAPRTVRTRDGAYDITWFPANGEIPVNEHTTVDVTVRRTDGSTAPVTGAAVAMSCFMPDHGHGTITEPRSVEVGDGKYRVEGFLLHMGGYWTVELTVVDEGLAATADDEITIE